MTKRIHGVIEKGSDGLYSVRSDDHFGNSYLGGFGDCVAKAKDDFVTSIKEALEEEVAEGNMVPPFEDIVIEYSYDIPSFFNFFDFINVTKFAEYAGVNESKMRAYKSGVSYPGEITMSKIVKAVKSIGQELTMAHL